MQAPKRRRVIHDVEAVHAPSNHHEPQTKVHAPYPAYVGGDDSHLGNTAGPYSSGQIGPHQALAPTSYSIPQHVLDATAAAAPPFADFFPLPDATPPGSHAQQPYLTNPSTYTSAWPPQSHAVGGNFGNAGANGYGATSTATMPYFDAGVGHAHRINEPGTEGAVTSNLPDASQDADMGADYGYSAPAVDGAAEQTAPLILDDASMKLKNQSLPILGNLATQLIQSIAKISLSQIQDILGGRDSEAAQAYKTLKSLFEQTRKVYSRDSPFIDAIAVRMFQPGPQEIIRKANIATFISSILGAHDLSFFHLNEYFLETFVPLGHRLLKWQGAILLELKTQAYISALMNSDGTPNAMLDELFGADLDAQILTRHPDAPSLSPSEQDFVDRCRARKSYLLAEGNAPAALKELPQRYQWKEFMREFAGCIGKNVDALLNASSRPSNATFERRQTLTTDGAAMHPSNGTAQEDTEAAEATTSTAPAAPTSTSTTSRQPWTKPEEDALLAGLERVGGPHWSQILALYGRGGSVSEVLKDRNQVQLKDKARNLKLWHLKMGQEVPVALRGVTGELRKRGGKSARAAALAGMGGAGEEVESGDSGDPADAATAARGNFKRGS